MKLLLLLILLNFSSFLFFGQDNSFKNYLKEGKIIAELKKINSENSKLEIQNAILLCKELKTRRSKFLKYKYLSDYSFYINKDSLGYEYLGKAFEYGNTKKQMLLNLNKLDTIKISEIYTKYYGKYLERIDTNLLNVLQKVQFEYQKSRDIDYVFYSKQKGLLDSIYRRRIVIDSINISIYDSLVNNNNGKWFSSELRGDNWFYKNKLLLPYLPIIHSNEKTSEKFLDLIIPECKKGNESWSFVSRLMRSQMWRFSQRKNYEYNKLRRIKFTEGIIDLEDDLTILTAYIIYIRFDNMSQITIYPTELWKDDSFYESIYMFRELIIGFGIEPYRIKISETKIPMDKNETVGDNYHFVFKKDY